MQKYFERLAWGTDAGFYRLIPEEVLMPADVAGVVDVVRRAHPRAARRGGRARFPSAASQPPPRRWLKDNLLILATVYVFGVVFGHFAGYLF